MEREEIYSGEPAARVDSGRTGTRICGVSRRLHTADCANVHSAANSGWKAADRICDPRGVRAGDALYLCLPGCGCGQRRAIRFRQRRRFFQDCRGPRDDWRCPLLATTGEWLGRSGRISRRARDDRSTWESQLSCIRWPGQAMVVHGPCTAEYTRWPLPDEFEHPARKSAAHFIGMASVGPAIFALPAGRQTLGNLAG